MTVLLIIIGAICAVTLFAALHWPMNSQATAEQERPTDYILTALVPLRTEGIHEVLADVDSPNGDRLIVLRTVLDTATIYSTHVFKSDGKHRESFRGMVRPSAPVCVDLGIFYHRDGTGRPVQRFQIQLYDGDHADEDRAPLKLEYGAEWRHA